MQRRGMTGARSSLPASHARRARDFVHGMQTQVAAQSTEGNPTNAKRWCRSETLRVR
jgi:hypothetical protein